MSLKREIEKIIQAEREKLESRDREHNDYHNRQRDRFQPLRALLDELVASIDPAHLKASIRDYRATIQVGTTRSDSAYFSADARWQIQPNYDVRFEAVKGESVFQESPGFRVEENVYHRDPEYSTSEKNLTFNTEEQVISYLLGKVAEQIAFYQHLRAQRNRQG